MHDLSLRLDSGVDLGQVVSICRFNEVWNLTVHHSGMRELDVQNYSLLMLAHTCHDTLALPKVALTPSLI